MCLWEAGLHETLQKPSRGGGIFVFFSSLWGSRLYFQRQLPLHIHSTHDSYNVTSTLLPLSCKAWVLSLHLGSSCDCIDEVQVSSANPWALEGTQGAIYHAALENEKIILISNCLHILLSPFFISDSYHSLLLITGPFKSLAGFNLVTLKKKKKSGWEHERSGWLVEERAAEGWKYW